jgi:hypothetical protein
MDRPGLRVVLALLLIGAGIVFLLNSLELVEIGALLWAAILAIGGLIFLYVYYGDREQWWALIPGLVLFSLGVLLGVGELLPGLEGGWMGALFLGGLGLAFWAIFLVRREFWWAVIPGGVLWSVALVSGLSTTLPGEVSGGVLFLGMGLTFALLSVLPTPEGRMRWALIPAAVMLILALITFAAAGGALLVYLWPAALILAGLYLLARAFFRPRAL